jgi:hypothetical protein
VLIRIVKGLKDSMRLPFNNGMIWLSTASELNGQPTLIVAPERPRPDRKNSAFGAKEKLQADVY